MRITSLKFKIACALLVWSASAYASTLFMGAYPTQVLVFDDTKGQMEARIQLVTGLPTSMSISLDRKTLYVTTNDHDGIATTALTGNSEAAAGQRVVDAISERTLAHDREFRGCGQRTSDQRTEGKSDGSFGRERIGVRSAFGEKQPYA